ncbi:MAG: diacylglycerol kinase family lipid kinase [Thermoleophilia bacterium]|nr:diacylglycerol kinase family lipid kinase [Thermoleophilia bacterium]
MRPPLLIVNPACGARGRTRDLPAVLTAVERTLGDVVIRYTARRGHARELALEGVREGYPLIVAVGGDGTFSEVANGVLDAADAAGAAGDEVPAVGVINVGTGGDFRRSLGIESGYERCLEALTLGRERAVDVGRATFVGRDGERVTQYFVNVLSAGLGGLVDSYMDSMPGFIGGRAGYYLASLRAVATSKEQPLRASITWEDETREETIPAYIIAICNGRWFGGGMDVAPMALPDDGRFEVITITEHTKRALARKVSLVYTGRHLDEPTVHHFPCHRIELSLDNEAAERRFLLDVDGDALGSLPLAIEVAPRRLRVRA